MPIPNRRKDEDKDKFVSRCMSNETMKKDYPDSKQRVAICIQQASAELNIIEAADLELQMECGYTEELNEDNFYHRSGLRDGLVQEDIHAVEDDHRGVRKRRTLLGVGVVLEDRRRRRCPRVGQR